MTEPYTPTTEEVREFYQSSEDGLDFKRRFFERGAEFDRWFLQEIEKAEYSGYLRAVREGLHR